MDEQASSVSGVRTGDQMYRTGREVRNAIRAGQWAGPTAGQAPGYSQANLVVLPRSEAFDFLRFCIRNPKPCPVLDVTDPGSPHPSDSWGADADLRLDLPRYRVYRKGELVGEFTDLLAWWHDDLVSFLLGCSFTFERELLAAGIPVRHVECGRNVPMYRTTRQCQPAGQFCGPLVVSMRPIPESLVDRAVEITSHYPLVHGAPVHVGDPKALGIERLERPDFGDPVPICDGEVPVFWACGVTPQVVALASGIDLMITHAPGHMFVSDRLDEELRIG